MGDAKCGGCVHDAMTGREAPCRYCGEVDPRMSRSYFEAKGAGAPPPEYTGGSVSYYSVKIEKPTSGGEQYMAECNDIIEALKMNYAEGNAFKAIWRRCAAKQGKAKAGYKDGLYDAEKVVFFGERMIEQEKLLAML